VRILLDIDLNRAMQTRWRIGGWLFLILRLNALAAGPENEPVGSVLCSDFTASVQTGVALLKAPLHFSTGQWLATSAVLTTTVALFAVDQDIRRFAQRQRSSFNDHLFKLDRFYGNGYTLLATGGLYAVGLAFDQPGWRRAGLRATQACIYSAMIIAAGKAAIGRRRPSAGDSQLFFKPFTFQDDLSSLPSGHAALSFAAATVWAGSTEDAWCKILCYGSAGVIAGARLYHHVHWFSDVFLGSAIGCWVGAQVMRKPVTASQAQAGRRWHLVCSADRVGVALTW